MPQKVSGRFMSPWDEIVGFFKVFMLFWVIAFVVLLCILGFDKWAFWGALGLGFITACIITILISLVTGVKNFQLPGLPGKKK